MKLKLLFLSLVSSSLVSQASAIELDSFITVAKEAGNAPTQCAEVVENKKPDTSKMPFFSQYNNKNNPYGTCQNTSVTMVAKFLQPNKNKSLTPDKVFRDQGGNARAKSPRGAAAVLKEYGVPFTKSTYNGNIDDLKYHLSQGRPAIVNGYFTAGHVVVVTDYDPITDEFIVNDPAGKWNQKYMGGYPYAGSSGKQVRYKAKNFIKTVMPGGPGDLWMAVGSNSDFSMKAPKGFKYPKREKLTIKCNTANAEFLNRGLASGLIKENHIASSSTSTSSNRSQTLSSN